jgi:Magnesium chelatase, subunit ChlI
MMAARLPGILPPLEPAEALELGMIQSVAGGLRSGGLSRERPFRDPHHSASLAALVGGGPRARPLGSSPSRIRASCFYIASLLHHQDGLSCEAAERVDPKSTRTKIGPDSCFAAFLRGVG